MTPVVGLVGAGMLGGPVGASITAAGFVLRVFDLDPARARTVAGATSVADAAAVAEGADVVLSCVDSPSAALAVAIGHDGDGLVSVLGPGQVYVELTTMSLDAIRIEAAAFAARDLGFVEAPVSGRAPHLTALLGGDAATVRRVAGVLDAFTEHQWHLGDVGAGTVAKLVNQYLTYANFLVAAEGVAVAVALGLCADDVADALSTCAGASRSLALVSSVLSDGAAGYSGADVILRDLEHFAALAPDATGRSAVLADLRDALVGVARSGTGRGFPHVLERYGLGPP